MRTGRYASLIAGIFCIAAASERADAHTQSRSFSSWRVQESGEVTGTFSASALEATRLGSTGVGIASPGDLLTAMLERAIALRSDGAECPPEAPPRALSAGAGELRIELRFRCPAGKRISLANDAFFPVAPSHVHYARLRVDGGPPVDRLFTASVRSQEFSMSGLDREVEAEPARSYFLLGVEHILGGVDHLAFLAALLLSAVGLRESVLVVTGFTIGHSLTLGLAVLGVVEPVGGAVEALIGYTIALVAAENVALATGSYAAVSIGGLAFLAGLSGLMAAVHAGTLDPIGLAGLGLFGLGYLALSARTAGRRSTRPLVTVLFGLVHGFGFAGVLMSLGLPTGRVASALLAFNLGVEVGQILVVAILWLVARAWARGRSPRARMLAYDAASAVLCAAGTYWFVGRAL